MNYYLKRRILFLAFLSFCVILQAQREEKRISGHVRDAQDLPLAGVNIKVKNTPYGAISNEKGEYVLKGQWEPGVSIEFSFIGMKRKIVTYKGQTRLDVTLLDDVNNMDEVVVTAKANINEIDIRARSGVVQEVDMRRINSKPMIDMGLALQGSVPGLIIQNTGELGSTPEIRIRGNSSLRKGNTTNEPLYIMYGKVISPMGCRAFLSPWYERGGMNPVDEKDEPVFVGRFNIGAVSIHLPMILAKSREENRDFFEVLDYYLELIRKLHIRTYEYLGELRASTNPLAYCEGGFYGGHLKIHDKIKPVLKSATASFGITALNEFQQLYNKKSLVEDGAFAIKTMEYINMKVNEFKKEDGYLYAIYGTPAENLCGVQVQQFRKKYGIVENVSDRAYVSNSFHWHVTEDITPIEKQDLENRFWDLCNGGKIQYVKYPINYNKEAIKSLVRRAMDMGFYEGVNLSLAYCDDCGHEELSMDVCPVCGSKNLTKIDRMNGYLSYSRVKGDTRLNDAKMAEIAERKSM